MRPTRAMALFIVLAVVPHCAPPSAGADGAPPRPSARDAGRPAVPTDAGRDLGPDLGPDDQNHTSELPPGVLPPTLRFWRGMAASNARWYTDSTGRRCAAQDTTMWFVTPHRTCGGAPSCDPDHFGPGPGGCIGTGPDCSWRNWDDPRGPELRVLSTSGPVEVGNQGDRDASGKPIPFGFTVWACAAPGTIAVLDTCPRPNVHACVETNYPELTYQCRAVPLPVEPSPSGGAGCYSRVSSDQTFRF